ncbi:MAG TPA: hypothetical protein VNG70_04825 [Candidatus Limnocylindria bacterium]|nr:hypothetical protein [Candidatus Limnocylindria bacterium]
MSNPGIRLESVRSKSGGRVHLTPRVPKSGQVTTLCGRILAAGSYAAVETDADCANCIRRSRDASRISSAFFAQEEGSELLRLSLEQARFRKPAPRPSATPGKAVSRPTVVSSPPAPEQVGDLMTRGFKAAGNGVWRSPGGAVVRMGGKSRDQFAELVFEGPIVATRLDDGLRLRAGDVEVSFTEGEVQVRLKRP